MPADDTAPVFRFAPSPNGYLHLGHALSALLNFDMARAAGGRFLLRIEDIDATRCRPEFEAAIYEDLAWLGHRMGAAGAAAVRASRRISRGARTKLDAMRLTFPSFESRAEIAQLVADRESHARWPRDPDGAPLYPGTARAACRRASARRASRAASPTPSASTWPRAMEWAGPLRWTEDRRRTGRRERRDRGRPAGLGRRHPRPQGDADQLSPRRWWSTTRCRA